MTCSPLENNPRVEMTIVFKERKCQCQAYIHTCTAWRNETEEEISKQGIKIVIYRLYQFSGYIAKRNRIQSMIETSKYALKSDKFRELVSMIRTCTTKSLIRETNRKFWNMLAYWFLKSKAKSGDVADI